MTKLSRPTAIFLLVTLLSPIANAQLLVADRSTNQISRYDAETGAFIDVLIEGNPENNGGLIFPSAMTLGPNDELLVASQIGRINRYNVDSGEFLGVFAQEINVPSGLHFDAAKDELLVSTLGNFDSELVLRYKATTGEFLSAVGAGTGASGRSYITEGPDENIYVSSFANGEFFLGGVLQFDGTTLEPRGMFAFDPFVGLAGASGITFHQTGEEGNYFLDVVGLFNSVVARYDVTTTEQGLEATGAKLLIEENLDFPSGIQPLGDGTMLITNLGNDNPATGELRPGSIGRFDIATGEFVDTFIAAGGEGALGQPSALLLLAASPDFDCNGDGVFDAADLDCACSAGFDVNVALGELGLRPGDFDASGNVEFADFLILSNNFGKEVSSYTDGDIDCNGVVEFEDFLVLAREFNDGATAASVPEPAGAMLLLVGMICFGARRPRRR